jgi:hypothetical protein
MIPLTKETIDNLFEPKRELRTAAELEAATGRLLIDGKGRFWCLTKERGVDHAMYFHWKKANRLTPEVRHDQWMHNAGWKKGTYPVWIDTDVATNNPWSVRPADQLPIYEYLPQPTNQHQLILTFYRLAFPNWDEIVKIDGWPRVSKSTGLYLAKKFMDFDRQMHPDVMPGGAWVLGSGFSTASEKDEVPDWCIDISPAKLVYPNTPFSFRIQENIYGEPPDQHRHYRARLIYDNGIHGQVDETDEYKRYETVDAAMAACFGRCHASLNFQPMPPSEWGEAVWQSNSVQALRKAA